MLSKFPLRDFKSFTLAAAAVSGVLLAMPAEEACAGELFRGYGLTINTYSPTRTYSMGTRTARKSTEAARASNPISSFGNAPVVSPSGAYSTAQSNEYEGRVLNMMRADDEYQIKLAAFRQEKKKREFEERKREDERRAELERQRWEQERQRQAALRNQSQRQGSLWQALDHKRSEQTITEAKNRTGSEEGDAPVVRGKKSGKQQTLWDRIKYVFLGA